MTATPTFGDIVTGQKKLLAAETLAAQTSKDARKRAARDSRSFTIALILTIVGIIGFFAGHIYVQSYKYPNAFRWWNKMKTEKPGKYKPNYSMFEVTTAKDYPPVAYVMTLGLWTQLTQKGGLFLLQCVDYFQSQGFELTALHWNGDKSQTNANKLMGTGGWACATGDSPEDRKNSLVKNWISSKRQNIWYGAFPDPSADGFTDFVNIPIIQDLYMGSARDGGAYENGCDTKTFPATGHLWALFDGGLCRVAFESTREDQSSEELFQYYFVGSTKPMPTCGGAAASGAISGGMGTLTMAIGLMMIPGADIGAVAMLAAAGAGAGAAAGYAAAKGKCENSAQDGVTETG